MGKTKEYSNGEMTIVWKPEICIHSGICVKGLGEVFQPKEKPWIKIESATTSSLIHQIKECPSGALTYFMNTEENSQEEVVETKVEVKQNGPLVVHGDLKVTHSNGTEETRTRITSFCRCGASSNKPFCDGAHMISEFIG